MIEDEKLGFASEEGASNLQVVDRGIAASMDVRCINPLYKYRVVTDHTGGARAQFKKPDCKLVGVSMSSRFLLCFVHK